MVWNTVASEVRGRRKALGYMVGGGRRNGIVESFSVDDPWVEENADPKGGEGEGCEQNGVRRRAVLEASSRTSGR